MVVPRVGALSPTRPPSREQTGRPCCQLLRRRSLCLTTLRPLPGAEPQHCKKFSSSSSSFQPNPIILLGIRKSALMSSWAIQLQSESGFPLNLYKSNKQITSAWWFDACVGLVIVFHLSLQHKQHWNVEWSHTFVKFDVSCSVIGLVAFRAGSVFNICTKIMLELMRAIS